MHNEQDSCSEEKNIFIANDLYSDLDLVFELNYKTISEIISDCLVILDTNVLLYLYELSFSSIEDVQHIYQTLIDERRLFIPEQVIREFVKNRPEKIKKIHQKLNIKKSQKNVKIDSQINAKDLNYQLIKNLDDYDKLKELIKRINDTTKEYQVELDRLSKEYEKAVESIMSHLETFSWHDPISSIYKKLFTQEGVVWYLELDRKSFKKELENRYYHQIPPGYKDNNKEDEGMGDLVIWKSILDLGRNKNRDIILVSQETKNDWFYRSDTKKLFPRAELIYEYAKESGGKSFHILALREFLEGFNANDKTISEVERVENKSNFFSNKATKSFMRGLREDSIKSPVKTWIISNLGGFGRDRSLKGFDGLSRNDKYRITINIVEQVDLKDFADETVDEILNLVDLVDLEQYKNPKIQGLKYIVVTLDEEKALLVYNLLTESLPIPTVTDWGTLTKRQDNNDFEVIIGYLNNTNEFVLYNSIHIF